MLIGAIAAPVRRRATRFLQRFSAHYSARTLLMVSAIYSLTFVALGIALAVLTEGVLGTASPWNWLQFTWRFALIWVLGLATIGAPAGLGVRELLMLAWFSPALGETAALSLAALLRGVTISADAAIFVFALLLRPARASRTT
jgi:hypothetical protein